MNFFYMWWGPTAWVSQPTWHAALHRLSTQCIHKGMSERGPEGEPREGERTEVKVKTPQARAFVRDQGFAGVEDGGGHALKGCPSV